MKELRVTERARIETVPMYVPHEIFWNEGLVTITTTKLNIQFDAVLKAFAGASNAQSYNLSRLSLPWISVPLPITSKRAKRTYSQVIPTHPMAKNELKTNKSTADTICVADVSTLRVLPEGPL